MGVIVWLGAANDKMKSIYNGRRTRKEKNTAPMYI